MRRVVVGLVAAGVFLSGCGGSPALNQHSIARRIGCQGLRYDPGKLGVQAEYSCRVGRAQVTLDRVASAGDRDQINRLEGSFGVTVINTPDPHWTVGSFNRPVAVRIARQTGWDLVS